MHASASPLKEPLPPSPPSPPSPPPQPPQLLQPPSIDAIAKYFEELNSLCKGPAKLSKDGNVILTLMQHQALFRVSQPPLARLENGEYFVHVSLLGFIGRLYLLKNYTRDLRRRLAEMIIPHTAALIESQRGAFEEDSTNLSDSYKLDVCSYMDKPVEGRIRGITFAGIMRGASDPTIQGWQKVTDDTCEIRIEGKNTPLEFTIDWKNLKPGRDSISLKTAAEVVEEKGLQVPC